MITLVMMMMVMIIIIIIIIVIIIIILIIIMKLMILSIEVTLTGNDKAASSEKLQVTHSDRYYLCYKINFSRTLCFHNEEVTDDEELYRQKIY